MLKNCQKQHEVKCKLSLKLNPARVQIFVIHSLVSTLPSRPVPT
nr:MAG TPA_asm: hypothetical protein [Caudoviricetes sp.]